MSTIKFRVEDFLREMSAPAPVPEPLGSVISTVRSRSAASAAQPSSRCGVWECSPGTWRRQVVRAEFCHFLAGDAVFTPDRGEQMRLQAGDVAYFPQGTTGVWEIRESSRKIFVVFDEGLAR